MKKGQLQARDREALGRYGLDSSKLSGAGEMAFEPGEFLVRQGEILTCLYIVTMGTAKVCINAHNGKNLIICYYVSSGILGDAELMQSDRSAFTTVAAVSPLRLIAIPLAGNEAYCRGNLAFMNSIAASLSEKLISSAAARAASALYTSEERLCAYILMATQQELISFPSSRTEQAPHSPSLQPHFTEVQR